VHEVLGDEGARRKQVNTTIGGHNLRVMVVMTLLAVLLLVAVALVFALRPAPTTSDRDAKPANHATSATRESDVTHLIPTSGSDGNPTIDAVSGTGGSSISQNPDVKRHAEVVERLGNGSIR
jgi:hypothetical protein